MPDAAPNVQERRQELYLAIGRFVCEFSQLEFAMRFFLSEFLGLSEGDFDTVTSPYDFRVLCVVVKDVFSKKLPKSNAARLGKIISDCLALNNQRVKIVHGLWVAHEGKLRHVPRQKLVAEVEFGMVEQVKDLADTALSLRTKFESVVWADLD
jgi:hypothetical protein